MGPLSPCLSILVFHRVLREPDPLFPETTCAADFDWQMATLRRWFSVLPLCQAIERLRAGTLPARAACVTFDDGYADNAEVALPILKRRGVPATFFVATDFIAGGRMWNDSVIETVRRARGHTLEARAQGLGTLDISTLARRRQAIERLLDALKYLPPEERQRQAEELGARSGEQLPSNLMMTCAQVRLLHESGMEVGAHTMSHPILANLEPAQAAREIGESKRILEAMIGAPVRCFAYPNGRPHRDYRAEHVALVKKLGFDGAVCTAWGVARHGDDPFQLPRFTPWDRSSTTFLIRLLRNTFRRAQCVAA
jgi:peptidoglycan/xylan/chitin deacetylase (PgdA/CDA1 family)